MTRRRPFYKSLTGPLTSWRVILFARLPQATKHGQRTSKSTKRSADHGTCKKKIQSRRQQQPPGVQEKPSNSKTFKMPEKNAEHRPREEKSNKRREAFRHTRRIAVTRVDVCLCWPLIAAVINLSQTSDSRSSGSQMPVFYNFSLSSQSSSRLIEGAVSRGGL